MVGDNGGWVDGQACAAGMFSKSFNLFPLLTVSSCFRFPSSPCVDSHQQLCGFCPPFLSPPLVSSHLALSISNVALTLSSVDVTQKWPAGP